MREADELFDRAFNGHPNIMTPNITQRGLKHGWAWELSHGKGITGEPIYGVTVIPADGSERGDEAYTLSQMFHSEQEALDHIASL